MTLIKKVIAMLLISVGMTSAYAFTSFKSIKDFNDHCPALTGLTYHSTNPYFGWITGEHDGIHFLGWGAHNVRYMRPVNIMDSANSGMVGYASPRLVMGRYGYTSGNNTVCLYSYPGYTGTSVALIMTTMPGAS